MTTPADPWYVGVKVMLAVEYLDGQVETFPIGDRGDLPHTWYLSTTQHVPQLIIGRGVPRTHVPLANVRRFTVEPTSETKD